MCYLTTRTIGLTTLMHLLLTLVCIPRVTASDDTVVQSTTLAGKLPSHSRKAFRLIANQSLLNDWKGDELAKGETDANGKFQVTFYIDRQLPALLFIGATFYKIWLQPSGKLYLEESNTGLGFQGPWAAENEFLYQAGLMQPFSNRHGFDDRFEPQKVTAYYDSIQRHRWVIYKKLFTLSTPDSAFHDYVKGQVNGFTCFSLSQYPMKFIYIDKTITYANIPSSYFRFWDGFNILSDSCESDMYHNALRDYISYLALKRSDFNISRQEDLLALQLQITDSLLEESQYTLARTKATQIDFMIRYFDMPQVTRVAVETYDQQFAGSSTADLLLQRWQAKNKQISTKPTFTLKDSKGKKVSLQDMRGSVVYIDFWGSWCKACLLQMPSSKHLQQRFAGREVIFLYVDFYDTEKKWIDAINRYKIPGVHVKAENEDEAYFNTHFGVNQGFPRYAVVGRDGTLITTAAPHPSDDRTGPFLEQLLKP